MSTKRRAYESGHKPKRLVVIDDSPGTRPLPSMTPAAGPCALGANVVMLRVIPTEDQPAMARRRRIMKQEAQDEANAELDRAAGRANGIAAITPERALREGDRPREILALIESDVDISLRRSAAGSRRPKARGLSFRATPSTAASFPVPVAIVARQL